MRTIKRLVFCVPAVRRRFGRRESDRPGGHNRISGIPAYRT